MRKTKKKILRFVNDELQERIQVETTYLIKVESFGRAIEDKNRLKLT
jgi:hypothetical protein